MSDSLRDQLLKSGLVQKLKSEAKPERRPSPPQAKPNSIAQRPAQQQGRPKPSASRPPQQHARPGPRDFDLASAYAQRAKQEREERERAQREVERVAREKKERKQKLAALLEGKALNSDAADTPRHFPHGNKIRRVYCTKEQLAALNHGELAVVQLAGRYLLVTSEIAVQAQAIQPETLVLLCDPSAPAEDDVPADLMW